MIQGAATHAFLTSHHLAADQLDEIDERLVPLYDEMMARTNFGYWTGPIPSIFESDMEHWENIKHQPNRFSHWPYMTTFGHQLAVSAKQYIEDRCDGLKIDAHNGNLNDYLVGKLFDRAQRWEYDHIERLEAIGARTCAAIYDIPLDLLNPKITSSPRWGNIRQPKTYLGEWLVEIMIGWGGLQRRNGRMEVVAKAIVWPMMLHELVKGSVELICLHGLKNLSDDDFELVMAETEQVEFEIPMLQVGGEFFRRFLAVIPREIPLAECIMHVSLMPAQRLESFFFSMMRSPNQATEMIRRSEQR
jgi:hypothetical protein